MKYEDGRIVKGCVTGIENYGIFVGLDEFYTGLIHISEISYGYVRNINDFVDVGEMINAKIIDVDHKNSHVKLSIKDIDYRISSKKRAKIKETGTGFYLLGEKLNEWISKKSEK